MNTSPRRQLLLAASALLAACGGGGAAPSPPPPPSPSPPLLDLRREGLDGRVVRRLRDSSLGLLAVTDSGLFRLHEQSWQSLGFAGLTLLDVVQDATGALLASSALQGLFRSSDAGASWQALDHDFGAGSGEPVRALLHHEGRLFATGYNVLAESVDGGQRWQRLAGSWNAAATGSPALSRGDNGDLWWGGQNAIEELVLWRRRASDGSLQQWARLLPSPSAVNSLRPVPGEAGRFLLCAEGGILQSRDDGASWQPAFVNTEHRFHFDVLRDPLRPRRWVSAAWTKTSAPQPLRIALSDDDALSWREIEYDEPGLQGGTWSMAVRVEDGRSVYRFGLDRGGVMRLRLPD